MKWMQIFYLFNIYVVDFSCIIKNKPSKSSNHKLPPKSNYNLQQSVGIQAPFHVLIHEYNNLKKIKLLGV
jgi:hypothetical protein